MGVGWMGGEGAGLREEAVLGEAEVLLADVVSVNKERGGGGGPFKEKKTRKLFFKNG